ncbi:hypothetical protein LTR70_010313 [Exophiala xenobiotica]|uniref:Uncharacterized protein n=1 Tax=Lithohypha guttulata TaxID=1690604 RepID=A0ABR0JUE3_9EURO|nr:hypothetical protein LTR24_010293 [Lithohypha guttulata]KAK5309409.1 hypothetical protein LTR70_010313 [Exophiala xenobiotica]
MAVKSIRSTLAGMVVMLMLALYVSSITKLGGTGSAPALSVDSSPLTAHLTPDALVDGDTNDDTTARTAANFSKRAIPPSHPFETIFELRGFADNQLQESMVLSLLVEALDLLRAGVSAMAVMDPNNPNPSFRRYFPAQAYREVRFLLNQLAVQLGLPIPQWMYICVPLPHLLPFKIFYLFAPGSADAGICFMGRQGITEQAYMSRAPYFGQPANERGRWYMVVCAVTLDFTNSRPNDHYRYRSLTEVQCDGLDNFASARGIQPFNYNRGGMFFSAQVLLHEFFHWEDLTLPTLDGIIYDEVYLSPSIGYNIEAITPWQVQELKRVSESQTVSNVQSFMWYLQEEFWRQRCNVPNGWKYAPRDYMDYPIPDFSPGQVPVGIPRRPAPQTQPTTTVTPTATSIATSVIHETVSVPLPATYTATV